MQNIQSPYISELQMENLRCTKAELRVDYSEEDNDVLKMIVGTENQISQNKDSVDVTLTVSTVSENNYLYAEIVLEATFVLGGDYTDNFKESIFKQNTLAIMFPFVRSQMSILTTQPGISPVILPPINTKIFAEDGN